MSYTADPDPLCYPGTIVLRNLLNIRDGELLEEVELALFLTRAEEPLPPGSFDVEHLLAVHRFLFQDVYPWAGQIRTIRIGKQNNWFCYASRPNWTVPSPNSEIRRRCAACPAANSRAMLRISSLN